MTRHLLLFALLAAVPAAAGQSRDPLPREGSPVVQVKPVFYPESLWSGTSGFGVGGGVDVQNIYREGTSLLLTGYTSQHTGQAAASFLTQDPYAPGWHGLFSAFYETTGRRWYYGLGPGSFYEDEIAVEKEMVEVGARAGYQLPQRPWAVLAGVRYQEHDPHDYRERNQGAYDQLDARSQRNLNRSLDVDPAGVLVGGDVIYDTRNNKLMPTRGNVFIGGVERYQGINEPSFRYTQFRGGAYSFLPMPAQSTLSLRAHAVLTREDPDSPELPFYLLPSLDSRYALGLTRNRYAARDLLVAEAVYRYPLLTYATFGFDLTLSAGLSSAYDDLFSQFSPAVSLEKDLGQNRDRYPLRPRVAVGGRLLNLISDRVMINAMIGLNAEGVSLFTVTFVNDPRTVRSPFLR